MASLPLFQLKSCFKRNTLFSRRSKLFATIHSMYKDTSNALIVRSNLIFLSLPSLLCCFFVFFFNFIFALRNFMELLFWHRGANGYGLEVIKTDQRFQRWKCTKAKWKWRCFFYWRLLKQWMRMVWFIFHLRRNLKFWNGRATWDKWAYETVVCYVRSRRNSTRNTPEKETQCK